MNVQLRLQNELEEMVSYRKNVTGVDHTIFISPKGNARHGARLKIAIDPPDSLDPRTMTATIAIVEPRVIGGRIPTKLLMQVRQFIDLNQQTLLDYWNYRIDTDQLRQRLQAVK